MAGPSASDALFGAPPADALFGAPPAAVKPKFSEADVQTFRRVQGDVSLLKNEIGMIRNKMQEMNAFHGNLHSKCDILVGYINRLKQQQEAASSRPVVIGQPVQVKFGFSTGSLKRDLYFLLAGICHSPRLFAPKSWRWVISRGLGRGS